MLVDHDRRDVELAQPRAERDAALAAADDEHVGLRPVAQLAGLPGAPLAPRLAVAVGAVLRALGPPLAARLLVPRQLVQRGQQRPRRAVPEAQVTAPSADRRLELQPRLGDAV